MNNIEDIRTKAISGVVWKLLERFLAQFVSMIVSIILARMLMPEDYSVVSIVNIFFAFCNILISGGFNTALIQKKDSDIIDYSSVLCISLIIAFIMYIIMFYAAPSISNLYNKTILVPLIRVMSITFFISAYKGVVCAQVSSKLQFKNFFISTIIGTVVSAFMGIIMAMNGFGPWSLVAQQMSNSALDSLILTITTKFKFKILISFNRIKKLFSYGWKIFVASIISVIYDEIRPLIVGVKFTPVNLSYYNKGRSFPLIVNSSLSDTISAVLFPVMCKFQDNKQNMLSVTRRYMKVSSYLIFPSLLGFFAVSDNFVRVVLTDKWLPASPYIKIFCVSFMFNIIQNGNLQVIRASGRSDIFLKLEIAKKISYFVVIALFLIYAPSPHMLAISEIACGIIATLINTNPTRRLFAYTYKLQIADLFPNVLISIIMCIAVSLMDNLFSSAILSLIVQIISGGLIYIILSIITKNRSFYYLLSFITERGKRI